MGEKELLKDKSVKETVCDKRLEIAKGNRFMIEATTSQRVNMTFAKK